MARKTRRARKSRKTRKQRGGLGTRLGFKNNTTPQMIQAKCAECMATKSKKGFCNLSTCGNYCAIDRTGVYAQTGMCVSSITATKLKPEPYIKGLTRIIIENGIEYVGPEGEISYGDTITSCTTVTIIFNENHKIGLHYNPATYIFEGDSLAPLNIDTMFEKINRKIIENNLSEVPIKAIYIFGASRYFQHNSVLLNMNTKEVRGGESEALNSSGIRKLFGEKLSNTIRPDAHIVKLENYEIKSLHNHYLVVRANGTLEGTAVTQIKEVPPS